MKIRYDDESDILYILIKEDGVEDTIDIDEDVYIEYGPNREIYGIEIWNASNNVIKPIVGKIAEKIKEVTRLLQLTP